MMAPMGRWVAGIFVIAAAAGAALLPIPSGWVEQQYARGWFPPLQRALTAASNTVPFALLDGLVLAGVAAVIAAAGSVGRAPRGARFAALLRRCRQGFVVAALGYLLFFVTWGANYRRAPLSAALDFDERRVTTPAVVALNEVAIREMSLLRPRLPSSMEAWPDRRRTAESLHDALDEGTRLLGLPGPVRPGRPKVSLLDFYFTRAGVTGMTDPFFLETLVASNLLPIEYPEVFSHEWGHLAGLARESDASFFGLVVCLHGGEEARYSAWLEIFLRTLNAHGPDERRAAVGRLPQLVKSDLRAMAERSARDEVRFISLMAWRSYDAYLRSNRVESGVRNYAEVVRLLAGTRFEPGWRPVLRRSR
jgi:hypothetical protein